jgi:copper chaperone CopZ
MTCAHVVNVALRKVAGVDAVDVSLNKGLATVKLKEGNKVTMPQLWQLIHEKGYTPKATTVTVRGLIKAGEPLQLKVPETNETLTLIPDPQNTAAYAEATRKSGQTALIQGVMTPGKDLKASVPLQVRQVK